MLVVCFNSIYTHGSEQLSISVTALLDGTCTWWHTGAALSCTSKNVFPKKMSIMKSWTHSHTHNTNQYGDYGSSRLLWLPEWLSCQKKNSLCWRNQFWSWCVLFAWQKLLTNTGVLRIKSLQCLHQWLHRLTCRLITHTEWYDKWSKHWQHSSLRNKNIPTQLGPEREINEKVVTLQFIDR